MSQSSGKLAVVLGLLSCAAGVGFAIAKKDAAIVAPSVAATASGESFSEKPPQALPDSAQGWTFTPPEPREDGAPVWRHDLFTPVEVTWKSGEYIPKGGFLVTGPQETVKFGLKLVALKHPRYRYRIMSIVPAPSKNPADTQIALIDLTNNKTVRGKTGQVVGPDGAKVQLLAVEDAVVKLPGGTAKKVKTVKVKDLAMRREIAVQETPVELPDVLEIGLADEVTGALVWTASAPEDKFEYNDATYTIKGVDFEGQSVTVAKTFKDATRKKTEKTVTEELPLTAPAPATPVTSEKQ